MNEGEKKKVDRGRGGPKFLFVYYHHYYTDLAVMKRKGTRVIPKAHRRLQSWRGLDLCVRKGSRQETLSSTESSEVSDLLSSFTCAYVYIKPVLLQYQPNQRSFFVVVLSALPCRDHKGQFLAFELPVSIFVEVLVVSSRKPLTHVATFTFLSFSLQRI